MRINKNCITVKNEKQTVRIYHLFICFTSFNINKKQYSLKLHNFKVFLLSLMLAETTDNMMIVYKQSRNLLTSDHPQSPGLQ